MTPTRPTALGAGLCHQCGQKFETLEAALTMFPFGTDGPFAVFEHHACPGSEMAYRVSLDRIVEKGTPADDTSKDTYYAWRKHLAPKLWGGVLVHYPLEVAHALASRVAGRSGL